MPQKKWYEHFPRITFVTISVFATYALMVVYDLVMGNALTSTLNQFALVCGYLTSSWLVVVVGALSNRAAKKLPAKPAQPNEERGLSDQEFIILFLLMATAILAVWVSDTQRPSQPPQSEDDKVIVIPWGG